jgi:DNA mismatch repair protein MutS
MVYLKDTEESVTIAAQNCMKQTYIQYMLTSFFGDDVYINCSEFSYYIYATQSYCYLLHFIQEHNRHFTKNILMPSFQNMSSRVILANHTLKQLNIISDYSDDGKKRGNLSSVLSFLNKCCTSMGNRLFKAQLTSPTFDEDWLNTEYQMIGYMLEPFSYDMIDNLRKIMTPIRDIEKIGRQLLCRKIYPASIFQLYKSLESIEQIHQCIYEFPSDMFSYICSNTSEKKIYDIFLSKLREIILFLESRFVLSACSSCNSLSNFSQNIIKKNVSEELDKMIFKYDTRFSQLISIRSFLMACIQQQNDHKKKIVEDRMKIVDDRMKIVEDNVSDTEYIRINETEKYGYSLQITKTRGEILQNQLKQKMTVSEEVHLNPDISFFIKDVRMITSGSNKTNQEIDFPFLNEICREMSILKQSIHKKTLEIFYLILNEFETSQMTRLEQISKYIAKIDVLVCKAFLAKTYRYCRPQIDSSNKKAFVDARDLRHVLIEHLQQQEIYVPNDICLGMREMMEGNEMMEGKEREKETNTDGILLYGTNAVGKTSLIRSLGISIIMAQAGLYVPCSKFVYKPYKAIYSRILGNDNLFKGLSTFAVEMSELRVILKNADSDSFILGDELCSGTETESALSIFVASLTELHRKSCSFIFATHFHEIVNYSEINEMNQLKLKHLEVIYDREKDCLIYDRKLRDGPGSRTYGLEVCKSLYLPTEFLEKAYSIRKKYFPENEGSLVYKTSHYNTTKIRGKCEMCHSEMGQEIHHLQEQKEADSDGYIDGHFHKNHPANLMSVCKKCHDKIHFSDINDDTMSQISTTSIVSDITNTTKKKIVRKKSTKGYILQNSI